MDHAPFEEFILNPNIGTDYEFLEFCKIYAKPVTCLYINLLPDDPSFYLWIMRILNFRGTYSAQYDTKVLERITQFLHFAPNIQVLILESDRDSIIHFYHDIKTDVGRLRLRCWPPAADMPSICPRTKIPLLPKLNTFIIGSWCLCNLPWTQELMQNAPEIEKPGTDEHKRRIILQVTADGMQMCDEYNQDFRRLYDTYVKDVEHMQIVNLKKYTRSSVTILDGPNVNYYVFPRVVTIELFFFSINDDSIIRLQPSSFPALRCVCAVPTPVSGSLNPFANNVYETVDEFYFECDLGNNNEMCMEPCRWHEIFPNVRKLVAIKGDMNLLEQHLSYLLPRFRKIETLVVQMRSVGNWKVIAGGNPDFVSFKKLSKLEYKSAIEVELLEELVTSSSLGYLNNVTSISISTHFYISSTIGEKKTLSYLENLNLKHNYVELIEKPGPRGLMVQFYPR